ncbi:trans-sialidase [Trypanosoma cruzi]|nr:trans-sialidase [Trypanosoma cruzi]
MDSDHHLSSHTAGTEDGIPRQACCHDGNMLPLPCVQLTGMLAPRRLRIVSGRCDHMVGDALRHRTSGSREIPTCIWTDGMEQAECVAAAACPELKLPASGRTAIMPSAVVSPCCWMSVQSSLVPSRAQACDALRHGGTTFPLSGIGCAAVLLGLRLCSASAAGKPLVRHTVRVAFAAIPTAACTVCARVPPGDWNMNWPFTPCAPDSAIRECLPGLAPGPGGVLSAFLRRLVPAARCPH